MIFLLPCFADTNIAGCSLLDQPGETYYLTADITNSPTSYCINISANDVTLDCQGHTIDGDDSADYGIYIYRSSSQTTNITIKNCIITDWDTANIYLYHANENKIIDTVSDSGPDDGIRIYGSSSNTLSNITANSNNYNGVYIYSSSSNTLSNITANSNNYNGIYLNSSSSNTLTDITANFNYNGISLYASSSNTFVDITTDFSNYGIYLHSSSSNYLANLTAYSNNYGIYLNSSISNIFTNITTNLSRYDGIHLYSSSFNLFTNLTANSNNNSGVYLEVSSSNTLSNITANFNYDGISFYSSSSNTLSNITANSNNYNGIYLNSSSSNTITHSTLQENLRYDFYIYAPSDSYCNNRIEDITGSNNLPIYYYNSSVTLSDVELSELVLCNADYSDIDRVTIDGSQTLNNNMLLLARTDNSTLSDIHSSNNYDGIYLYDSSSNVLSNITSNSNFDYGIRIYRDSDNNIIANSTISYNGLAGLYLDEHLSYDPEDNIIYNCLFRNSGPYGNVRIDPEIRIYPNYFNTKKQLGTRIYSYGSYIGGNYYTNPAGSGYSDTCIDSDTDGFCDNPLNLSNGTSVAWDYLPLSDKYMIKHWKRDLYVINPTVINLKLGERNKDIVDIWIRNPHDITKNFEIIMIARNYNDLINWITFATPTGFCGPGCKSTHLTVLGCAHYCTMMGESLTKIHLYEAPRVGNYDIDIIIKNGTEVVYTKKIWLNIYSEALGSENSLLLVCILFVVIIILYKSKNKFNKVNP